MKTIWVKESTGTYKKLINIKQGENRSFILKSVGRNQKKAIIELYTFRDGEPLQRIFKRSLFNSGNTPVFNFDCKLVISWLFIHLFIKNKDVSFEYKKYRWLHIIYLISFCTFVMGFSTYFINSMPISMLNKINETRVKANEVVSTPTNRSRSLSHFLIPTNLKSNLLGLTDVFITKPISNTDVVIKDRNKMIKKQAAIVDHWLTHRVLKGETLNQISLKYYGEESIFWEIVSKNKINNPDLIYEGKLLQIKKK